MKPWIAGHAVPPILRVAFFQRDPVSTSSPAGFERLRGRSTLTLEFQSEAEIPQVDCLAFESESRNLLALHLRSSDVSTQPSFDSQLANNASQPFKLVETPRIGIDHF